MILSLITILSDKNSYAEIFSLENHIDGFGWSMGISSTDNEIFIADGIRNEILIFNASNYDFIKRISLQENNCKGHIHGMDIMNQIIYVVKQYHKTDQEKFCVGVFNLSGEFVTEFGSEGSEEGEFKDIQNIEIFKDRIYVTDTGNHRIQIFDLSGEFVTEFGSEGSEEGEFERPFDIEIFKDRIYVTDTGNHRIQIFDLSGEFVTEFGSEGSEEGEFDGIMGIKVEKQHIFVVDGKNHRIQIFDLSGEYIEKIENEFKTPHQILIIQEKILVLDTYNYQIKIFSGFNQLVHENNDTIIILIIFMIVSITLFVFLKRKSIISVEK